MVDQLSTHERDLEAALSFQESLLGRLRPRPGVNIAAEHRFCETMGGDFYDILDAGDGTTALLMADVSGHGVPAALVTGMLKAQIRASEHRREPAEFLKDVNRHLFPTLSVKGQFLTAAYAVIDPRSETLAYASAGHNPLAVVRRDTELEEYGSTGFPVGMLEELDVAGGSLQLEGGDAVWLYTDGLFECPGPRGRGYGRHALLELIREARHADVDRWARTVFSTCQDFLGGHPPADDMTVVCAVAAPGS
jgi:sigma-B regulation protein RsbU (phosphoserine phosphatase)